MIDIFQWHNKVGLISYFNIFSFIYKLPLFKQYRLTDYSLELHRPIH